MIRKSFYALLTLLSGLSLTAQAADFQALEGIYQTAADYVEKSVAPGATVSIAPLDTRLRLPDCGDQLQASTSTATATAANVQVRCANPEWAVYVPVRISLRKPVVVLRSAVTRGAAITETDVALETRDVGTQTYYSDIKQVVGKTLRRPLATGSVLNPDVLAAPLLVKRGELITLIGRAGLMEVRTQGKAMGDGAEGQAIQVQNTASGRVVGAVVKASGEAEVKL